MEHKISTDYSTYREIIDDLLRPIVGEGVDDDTLHRLYESKLVYLENLRVKCFREMNKQVMKTRPVSFSEPDFQIILNAIESTRAHLSNHVKGAITRNLEKVVRRKAG